VSAKHPLISRLAAAFALSAVVLGAAHTLLAAPASTPRSTRSLAAALARLRTDVETLSSQIQTKRTDMKTELQSVARQKSDLELQVKREQLRIAELRKKITEHKKRVAAIAKAQQALNPVIHKAARELKYAIAKTLPFKRVERQQAVASVIQKLDAKMISPLDALGRIWARVEDELRLLRESGLYQHVLRIDGKERLVEVARLGTVMMYYRTKDGRYGMMRRSGQTWTQVDLTSRKKKEQVAKLFDAFKKQLRVGLFRVPNGLPKVTGGTK